MAAPSPTPSLDSGELQDREARDNSPAKQGNQNTVQQLWKAQRQEGHCATSICTAYKLGAPRSAAIFNSKACQLWEVRSKSCDTSEWEPPEGTAAFYTRLAHQLSTFKKPPSPASPGTWQRSVRGLVCAFHSDRPRAQHSAGRYPAHGCWVGFACTLGLFYICAPVYLSNLIAGRSRQEL